EEIDGVLKGEPPSLEKLSELPYTAAVVDEALRLYPPAWIVERRNLEPERFQGFEVRRDTDILMSPFVLHHLGEWWEDAERFVPERFLPGANSVRHPFAYFPFGGGPRVCIGKSFALMETQIVLALITQKYRIELIDEKAVTASAEVTLSPRHGIAV